MINPFRFFNKNTQSDINKSWAEDLTYKGFDLFAIMHNDGKTGKFYNKLHAEALGFNRVTDVQECLLAYYPNTDLFVLGFDIWKEKYSGDGLETGGVKVIFSIDENRKVSVIAAIEETEMVYDEGGLYSYLEAEQTKDSESVIFIYTK